MVGEICHGTLVCFVPVRLRNHVDAGIESDVLLDASIRFRCDSLADLLACHKFFGLFLQGLDGFAKLGVVKSTVIGLFLYSGFYGGLDRLCLGRRYTGVVESRVVVFLVGDVLRYVVECHRTPVVIFRAVIVTELKD